MIFSWKRQNFLLSFGLLRNEYFIYKISGFPWKEEMMFGEESKQLSDCVGSNFYSLVFPSQKEDNVFVLLVLFFLQKMLTHENKGTFMMQLMNVALMCQWIGLDFCHSQQGSLYRTHLGLFVLKNSTKVVVFYFRVKMSLNKKFK